MNFLQFTQDQNLGGCGFPGSWYPNAWETVIKAADALPLNEAELALYRQCTGRQEPPQSPAQQINLICGRRSGKSRITAEWGVHAAVFADLSLLGPGETGHVVIIGPTQKQANLILNYCRAIFRFSPILGPMVVGDVDGEIRLNNNTAITVMSCSSASVRGFTLLCAIFEETSSWRVDGRDPGVEIQRAVLPGLATTGGRRISIGSPRAMAGIDYEAHKQHFGVEDSDVLVWVAPSRVMNPTLSQEVVDRALAEDYESAKAEYLAEWRSDLETFFDLAALQSCVIQGRYELPARLAAVPRLHYQSFVDPSGGKRDAAALSIVHREKEVVVVDLARRWPAPHVPAAVVAEQAEILKSYGISMVCGDMYAGAWPGDEFSKHGIRYEPSDRDKSKIYLDFLPLVMSGNVELLDNKTLFNELRSLERRARSTRDQVDHPPGAQSHDDLSNAVAGACTLAARRKREARILTRPLDWRQRPEPVPAPPLHPRLQYK